MHFYVTEKNCPFLVFQFFFYSLTILLVCSGCCYKLSKHDCSTDSVLCFWWHPKSNCLHQGHPSLKDYVEGSVPECSPRFVSTARKSKILQPITGWLHVCLLFLMCVDLCVQSSKTSVLSCQRLAIITSYLLVPF